MSLWHYPRHGVRKRRCIKCGGRKKTDAIFCARCFAERPLPSYERLEQHARERLSGSEIVPNAGGFMSISVAVPARSFYLHPAEGLVVELPNRPESHGDAWQISDRPRVPEVFSEDFKPGPKDVVHHHTLFRSHWVTTYRIPVTEPAPRRHDRRGRWKAAAPGRRRNMKSWRYASDEEKLRYAPMLRRGRFPYGADPKAWPSWAKHPQHNERQRIGYVDITQCFNLFKLPEESGETFARELGDHFRLELTCRLALAERNPDPARLREVLCYDAEKHGIRLLP